MTTIDSRKLTRWYDFMAPFYGAWRDDYRDPMLQHVRGILLERPRPGRLLDAGCGTGLYAIGLSDARWHIDAVDASEGMLRVARRKAAARGATGVAFGRGDVARLPFPDASFDVVIAAGLVPNLERPDLVFPELCRVLAPDARLLLVEVDRAAMSRGSRLFFRAMILGYRSVSALFSRFRFADRWDLNRSTVDPTTLLAALEGAGFSSVVLERRHGQLLVECRRARATAR